MPAACSNISFAPSTPVQMMATSPATLNTRSPASSALVSLERRNSFQPSTTVKIPMVVLGWKLFRRSKLTSAEEAGLRVLSVAGLVAVIWTGVLGAKLMFEHAAGIPNATLQAEIENREAGHHHEAGEAEEHEHAAPADTAKAAAHTRAPGTPPHKH